MNLIDIVQNNFSRIANSKKIILTGSAGFLGSRLFHIFSKKYFIIPVLKNRINIFDENSLEKFILPYNPDYVIHCAAISNPDYCEKNKDETYKVNFEFTEKILSVCEKANAKFIFISSAMVFEPVADIKKFFDENSEPDALNYYGRTKIMAEEIIKKYKNYLIVRIGWQYSKLNDRYRNSNSMVHYIYNEAIRKQEIKINKNFYGNPTFVYDTIKKLLEILDKIQGIVHIVSPTDYSMDYFFKYIFEQFRLDMKYLNITDEKICNQRIISNRIENLKNGDIRIKEIIK